MSVITTADEKLHSAAEHVKAALQDLGEIAINDCWGHDDFSEEYKETIAEVMNDLIAMKRKLSK